MDKEIIALDRQGTQQQRPEGYICYWGHPFFQYVPLVEFKYLVFTRTPGGVIVGDSGLCCCVPCLSSAIISLWLLILHKRTRPHSVSDLGGFN